MYFCTPPDFKRKRASELPETSKDAKTKGGSDARKTKRKRVERKKVETNPPRKETPEKPLESHSEDETSSGAPKTKRKRVERNKPSQQKKFNKLVESSEDETPRELKRTPRLKKKTRRSHSSEESCSGDEVDSEHIIQSRLRTKKSSRKDFLLENIKRKKKGLPPLESEPDTPPDESDDTESSFDSLFDEDSDRSSDFIVEDDGAAPAMLPTEFSMVTHESLSAQFKKIFQFMVHLAVRPPVERAKFMTEMLKTEKYFSIPYHAARRRIFSIRDSLASFRWKPAFTELLAKYPDLEMEDLPSAARTPICDVCNIQGRRGYRSGTLSGIPYNRTGFGEIDDEFLDDGSSKKGRKKDAKKVSNKDSKKFNVGRFCAERTLVFHKICHWEYELFKGISHEVDQLHEMQQSSGVFNDRDVFVPIKKLDVDVDDADAIYEWLDKRNKVQMEWEKIKLIIDQAQNVEKAVKRGKTD